MELKDWQQVFIALTGLVGAFLGLARVVLPYLRERIRAEDDRNTDTKTRSENADEALRLRDELRRENARLGVERDELERELERWKRSWYQLERASSQAVQRALTQIHIALGELDGTRYEAVAKRLQEVVSYLEKLHLPSAPDNDNSKQN